MTVSHAAQNLAADRVRLLIGVIIGLYWFIAVVAMRERFLADPDIWWHIKTGSWIWAHGAVPVTDPFSFSYAGHPWIAKELLSQLVYAGAYALEGWSGVVLLGALALALGGVLLYWSVSTWVNPSLAIVMALLGIFLATPAITIRPHLLTLPIVILWTDAVFAASGKGRAPSLWWLALILLWANLHAAFTMGFVIAGFAFLDFLEQTRLGRRKETLAWLLFLVLCPLVTLIHPYGYKAMLATWLVVGPNEAVGVVNEWQPFNAKDHWVQGAALLGLIFAALAAGFRPGIARALLLVLLTYLFITHVRYAFYLFPVLAAVIAPALARQFPRLSAAHWREQPADRSDRFLSARFRPLMAGLAAVAVATAGLALLVLRTAPPERVSAASAIAYAKAHGISGNVFNNYNFGGTLIFHDIATFIDGRTEQLFLGDFIKNYATGPFNEADMKDMLQRYDISWTLLPPGDRRVALLDKLPGWKRVYTDPYATIHQRQ